MLVASEGRAPGVAHLIELARRTDLKATTATEIRETVRAALEQFARYADEAGVPPALRKRIANALGVPASGLRKRSARRR
jgi:hypothetical protein